MLPSLFTLFQRGRYFRIPERTEDDSPEIQRARLEAERFAAAAVAFCMKHHAGFRGGMLTKVCGFESIKGKRCRIEVEPESCSDVLICLGRNDVCVLEFKISAALQPRQNPSNVDFWKEEDGYGARIGTAYPRAKKRYIVLGCRDWYGVPASRNGWLFRDIGWQTVLEVIELVEKRSPLIGDLRDCLSKLGIWEFSSNMTKDFNFSPSSGITAAAAAQLLWDVITCPYLKLSTGITAVRWEIRWESRDRWRFGIALWPQADVAMGHVLRPNTQSSMAWIGYESTSQLKFARRAAWFYCDDSETAGYIARKLRPQKDSRCKLLTVDDEPTYVGIRLENDYESKDQSHFIDVLAHVQNFAKTYVKWKQSQAEEVPAKRRKRATPRKRHK